jgi:hypothetical protein
VAPSSRNEHDSMSRVTASPRRRRRTIPAARRPIRRPGAAGAGRVGPRRVRNACAARRVAAEDLLALLEAVVGAVHGPPRALQAERLLFMLCVRRFMRSGDQRGSDNSQCKRQRAHKQSLSASSRTLQTKCAADCSVCDAVTPSGHARGRAGESERWRARCDIAARITPPPRRAARHPTRGRCRA